jgi:hypothetical protein
MSGLLDASMQIRNRHLFARERPCTLPAGGVHASQRIPVALVPQPSLEPELGICAASVATCCRAFSRR